MSASNSLTAVKGYLGATIQAADHDQQRQSYPAITITRQTGARGVSIGSKLIDMLQESRPIETPPWTLFEKELIKRVLQEKDLPVSHEKYFPEDKRNYIDDVIEEIAGLHPPAYEINQECNSLIQKLCRRGHVIIVGRCGNILTRDMKNVLKVRFVGSMENRVRHLMKIKSLSEKVAESYLKKEDLLRKRFAKENFGITDVDNPLHYDFVINTDSLSDNKVARFLSSMIDENH